MRTIKKGKIIVELIILSILVLVLIALVVFLPKEKSNRPSIEITSSTNEIKKNSKTIKEIYYSLPFIFDAKAALKAQYLDLRNYTPLKFVECLKNLRECQNDNLLITAYIYKKANKEFCNNLNEKLNINGKEFKVLNLETLKEVCKVFYKMKNKTLEKKDCISPEIVPICDYYFSLEEVDFIKSSFQLTQLINKPEEIHDCLKLEEPAAYYCLKIKQVNCNNFEDIDKIKKCNEILVNHDVKYKEFLRKVENIVKNRDWESLKKLILATNNSKILHSLARLGAINREICEAFLQKSKKEYRYCLKRYYNQNFICELSPDKRQCHFFDVLLNNKSCSSLRDPQHQTDCELFKKYLGKKDCNFFYTVGADEYLGYLCAVKTGRCEDKAYYDEMYKINCKYLNGQI